MSTGGQAALGVVGAVVGFLASGYNPAGALYGAQIGIMTGDFLALDREGDDEHL